MLLWLISNNSLLHILPFSWYRGNSILVGSIGQPLNDMAKLSLYISGYTVYPMNEGMDYKEFRDSMRSLFRLAGLEGNQVALIMNVSGLKGSGCTLTQNETLKLNEL